MSENTRPKFGCTINRNDSRDYFHLMISIVLLNSNDVYTSRKEIVTVTWQGNKDDKSPRWYGGTIAAMPMSSKQDYQVLMPLMRKLFKQLDNFADESPAIVTESLENGRIPRVIYDARTSKYHQPTDIADPSLDLWKDSHKKYSTYTVLASDETDAQRLIALRFAKDMSDTWSVDRHMERLNTWINAGKPVENLSLSYYGPKAPTIEDIETLISIHQVEETVKTSSNGSVLQ